MVIDQEAYDKGRKKKIKIDDFKEPLSAFPDDAQAFVPSSTTPGVYYLISGEEGNLRCSCPARVECKHLKDYKNGKGTSLRISGCIQAKV